MNPDPPPLHVESRAQWRDWLAADHGLSRGVWVTVDRKGSGGRHVPYDDLVDEAIAFGWVDSQPRRLDDRRSQLRMTPRNPRSNWSRVEGVETSAQHAQLLTMGCRYGQGWLFGRPGLLSGVAVEPTLPVG